MIHVQESSHHDSTMELGHPSLVCEHSSHPVPHHTPRRRDLEHPPPRDLSRPSQVWMACPAASSALGPPTPRRPKAEHGSPHHSRIGAWGHAPQIDLILDLCHEPPLPADAGRKNLGSLSVPVTFQG